MFFIYLFNIYAPNIDFQIKIDFELLHNTKTNCLFDKWEIAARHLIKLIKDAQLSVVDKTYLDVLPSLTSGTYHKYYMLLFFDIYIIYLSIQWEILLTLDNKNHLYSQLIILAFGSE